MLLLDSGSPKEHDKMIDSKALLCISLFNWSSSSIDKKKGEMIIVISSNLFMAFFNHII